MTRKRKLIICIFLTAVLFVAGCSLVPEYKRPEIPVEDSWPEGDAYKKIQAEEGQAAVRDIPAKAFFINEKLQKVLELAISNNKDLKVAALNIEKMRALYKIQKAELFPDINGSASKTSSRTPESLSFTGNSSISHRFDLSAGISSYELDFFGRIRSLKEAALEQYLSTEQAKKSLQISLVSNVAGAWLTLAADREKLKLANETFEAQKKSYAMIERRSEVGASSELDLRQAQTRLEAARIDIARYTGTVAQDENALRLLLGCALPKELLPEDLSVMDGDGKMLRSFDPGLPSSVLFNRPDILAAERNLLSVNANIGAARAAFFPRISLTGSYGVASSELDNLFSEGAAWSFMPQISIPIFSAGRNKANLDAAKVDRDIAVANYEQAIQAAFKEVSDALAQSGTVDDQLAAQKAFLEATSESYRLSEIRYQKGIDSYLTVLDAQRSLYGARQQMIDVRLLKLVNRVTLYKVLGGGVTM